MQYDPHGTELLDVAAHYMLKQSDKPVNPIRWCKAIREGIRDSKCDTDFFILLTRLTTEGSPTEYEQAELLATSLYRQEPPG